MECNLRQNRDACTCTYEPCSRKGRCCECISYHRAHGELPGCLFPPQAERTYDRSLRRFLQAHAR
ncbi:MAG: DUF6485 family protein [Bacillota bacterium]|nr:DUF6485 family protein [Bacillota bacterium]MDI7248951.1 DUF6485 family protein [Bacillota bacterium]